MLKEVHIWDLPINKVYIKLNCKFAESFFLSAHDKFGNWKVLGKSIKIKRGDTAIAKNWKNNKVCYPLKKIFQISSILNITKEEIEKNIIEIKAKTFLQKRGGSSGKPIINPKFPIKITPDFCEILGHICGDGTISRTQPKKGINLKFINSEPRLIKEFKNLMNKVFGNIKPTMSIRKDPLKYRRPNYVLQYPTIISFIVLRFWDYKTNDKMMFPEFIHELNEECKCTFLRALFDDEGYVPKNKKTVIIGMKPISNIIDIKKLLDSLGIYVKRIERKRLNILTLAKSDSVITFYKKIGFKHPKKKLRLEKIIEKGWKFKRHGNNEIRKWILDNINKGETLTKDRIAKQFNITKGATNFYLKELKTKRLLKSKIVSIDRFIRHKEYISAYGKN